MDFKPKQYWDLIHWTFGVTVLSGFISAEYSGGEAVLAVLISGLAAIFSGQGGLASDTSQIYNKKKISGILYFFIIWFDVLTNLAAAAACARLTSATVDYISRGHFREFLFGIESHCLGEPWPDVLGVTIIVVVALLFMMGLEKSLTISSIISVTGYILFIFFIIVGNLSILHNTPVKTLNFQIHSAKDIITASAFCSFGFTSIVSNEEKKGKETAGLFKTNIISSVFYFIIVVLFSFLTTYRELSGTAIPLVTIFEARDVDWARAVMAVLTICCLCLVLTEIMPITFQSFVNLAGKDWRIFISSVQYQSTFTGAPVLAIFAAGSLAAILAFACPLTHLIKLINTSYLLKVIINAMQVLFNKYKPEMCHGDVLVYHTNVQYQKLNQNPSKIIRPSWTEVLKSVVGSTSSNYISRIPIPKSTSLLLGNDINPGEQEGLLLEDYSNVCISNEGDDSQTENEEDDILSGSEGEESTDSTDIDVVVQEYKDKLKVTTITKFNDKQTPTLVTFILVIMLSLIFVLGSIGISQIFFDEKKYFWPSLIGIMLPILFIINMPQNSSEKQVECFGVGILAVLALLASILLNISFICAIIFDIWQGVVFWTLAGLILFFNCNCCAWDAVPKQRHSNRVHCAAQEEIIYEYKSNQGDTVYVAR